MYSSSSWLCRECVGERDLDRLVDMVETEVVEETDGDRDRRLAFPEEGLKERIRSRSEAFLASCSSATPFLDNVSVSV